MKHLRSQDVAQFQQAGYLYPVSIITEAEANHYRASLEAYEQKLGHPVQGPQRTKPHLLFKWVDDLMRNDEILDAVEDLIGPDLLCWNTLFWIKEPGSTSFVSWHQDLRYWGLDTHDLVSVWLALSPATLESGCMRVLPGSHKKELLPHKDRYAEDNLLTRGQEIAVSVDEEQTVAMPLKPGEVSLHNVRLAHASGPNQSDDRRIGLSLHYMPTRTKQTVSEWDSAALVRGEDRFGHFKHAPRPTKDFDPAAVEFHQQATNAVREILFTDADKVRSTI